MNRRFAGLDHAEQTRRDWPGFASLAVTAPEILVPHGYRAVIIAPRADDETLGLPGLIARLIVLGRPVLLVAASDRAAGPPVPIRWTPQHKASERLPNPLRALRCVGAARSTLLRAGLKDGELAGAEDDLERRLRKLILPLDVVFATWRSDGNPDHEAMGRVAARVCTPLFAPLVEVPVWAWHWSIPRDRRIPWHRARRVFIDRALRAGGRLALAEARRQARTDDPGTGGAILARDPTRGVRPYEIVFV